jgi:hypothetical protein
MHKLNATKYFACILASFFVLPTFALAAPFTFATLGDTQDISDEGQERLNSLIESVNQRQPSFVVHIGELKGGGDSCHDEYYQRLLRTANRFNNPLVYLPGDNDWTDCFHSQFNPLERLGYLRKLLYSEPVSLGKTVMPLTRQSVQSDFRDFPENVWWQQGEVLFASFHNVGTNNNLYTNLQAIQEHLRRDAANLAWLDQIFERASSAKALVIFTHANIRFDALPWDPTGFDNFRAALIDHVRRFARPVLFVHGDTHKHKIDKPLRYNGETITNFTRLEVFGSPDLGVIYVHVHPETEHVFRFEPVALNSLN